MCTSLCWSSDCRLLTLCLSFLSFFFSQEILLYVSLDSLFSGCDVVSAAYVSVQCLCGSDFWNKLNLSETAWAEAGVNEYRKSALYSGYFSTVRTCMTAQTKGKMNSLSLSDMSHVVSENWIKSSPSYVLAYVYAGFSFKILTTILSFTCRRTLSSASWNELHHASKQHCAKPHTWTCFTVPVLHAHLTQIPVSSIPTY